jgi:surfactin synthase thioesterase subunit
MSTAVSLLCLPCAGASATMYLRWRRLLPRWVELIPVELPGRGGRLGEGLVEDFDALVARLCAEQAHAMRGSFAIFGHSMGALLAYGMAQRLRVQGLPLPSALMVSGSAAPTTRDPDRFIGKDNESALIADLRKQGGTPAEVFASAELMRITLDAMKADYLVCQSFRPTGGAPLNLPVHAFGGRQDDIDAQRISAWSAEAAGTFTVDWFEGGHFFIRQQERAVLDVLAKRLEMSVAGATAAAHALA